MLVGGTGTGKTHLAIAVGRGCVRSGARVRFYNTVDLVNRLEAEARAGKPGRIADHLSRLDLVILDELGYLPFARSGGQLLFHLVSKLYEQTSIVVTTNLAFGEWPSALLERWSDEKRKTPGWVQKPLACDFIAYAYAPAATCVLLPVPALQRAWCQHGRQWIGLYGQRRAQNRGYTTISVPVPRGMLMQAIVEAMFVS